MSMDRWNPFRDNFDNMRQAMDRWVEDRMPGGWSNQSGSMMSVAVDVRETERGFELEASLPGVRAEDLEINVDRDTITLRGQNQIQEDRRDGKNYIYRERRAGAFMRSIRLPEPVDNEQVEASLDHGILRIQLPRLSQTQQRRVPVRSGQNVPGGSPSFNITGQPQTGETSARFEMDARDMGRAATQADMASTGMNNTNQPQASGDLGIAGSRRLDNESARGWSDSTGGGMPGHSDSNQSGKMSPNPMTNAQPHPPTNNSNASGSTGISPNLQTGSLNQPATGWTPTQVPTVGRGAPVESQPGGVGPGASHGEHSEVDHRGQTGTQTYTSGGYRQSPQNTGTSSDSSTNGQPQSGAGSHGAGQTSDNVSQSQTMGNNE